jgi:hypothetical protein
MAKVYRSCQQITLCNKPVGADLDLDDPGPEFGSGSGDGVDSNEGIQRSSTM